LTCMAHARRKFEHAKDNNPQRDEKVLTWIGSLYDIERVTRDSQMLHNEIKKLRNEKSSSTFLLPVRSGMLNPMPG
jgi:transposase